MDIVEELPTGKTVDIWNFSFQLPCALGQLKPVNLQCDISELVFLEIFAGSGNLSKAAREIGYSIHPVDSTTKRQMGVAMHVLDLTKESDTSVLLDLVCSANIASGHMAPPCGRASRSREKPMPPELNHIRSVPLRSDERPLGLQGLEHLDSIRVAASNRLYALTLLVMCILYIRGASTSVENPSGSQFWSVLAIFAKEHSWMQQIMDKLEVNKFQVCMYGSDRDKWTSFKGTASLYTYACAAMVATNMRAGSPKQQGLQSFFLQQVRQNIPWNFARL